MNTAIEEPDDGSDDDGKNKDGDAELQRHCSTSCTRTGIAILLLSAAAFGLTTPLREAPALNAQSPDILANMVKQVIADAIKKEAEANGGSNREIGAGIDIAIVTSAGARFVVQESLSP